MKRTNMNKKASVSEQEVWLKKTRTKKEIKAYYAQSRVMNGKNTGTITHKSPRDYSRKWKLSDYD